MFRLALLSVLLLPLTFLAPTLQAEEDGAPLMTPIELLNRYAATEVFEFSCPTNTQCQARCSAGEAQERFDYANVKRLEMARSPDARIVVAVYMDAVGKGHRATGILPNPVSCIFDDLLLQRTSPLTEGELLRPSDDEEVIFEFRAQ